MLSRQLQYSPVPKPCCSSPLSTVTASPKVYQRINSVLGMVLFLLRGAIGCFTALGTGSPSPPSLSITPLATKQCLANNWLLLITMKLFFCAICHLYSSSKNVLGTPLVASAVYWDHSKQIVLEMFLFTWAYHIRIQNKLQNRQINNNKGERTLPLCFSIHSLTNANSSMVSGPEEAQPANQGY